MISFQEKLWRRAGHFAFEFRGFMYLWGGYSEHIPKVSIKCSVEFPHFHDLKFSESKISKELDV